MKLTENEKLNVAVLRPSTLSNFQFFLQWFTDACSASGFPCRKNIYIPYEFRKLVAKTRISRTISWIAKRTPTKLIVPCAGYPDPYVFPCGYTHEIIPVLWDTWPRYHGRIVRSFIRHHVRLAFFMQRQVAEWVHLQLPNVDCVWLPEGIDVAGYKKGPLLRDRSVDLLEFGRVMPAFHHAIEENAWVHRYPKERLLFSDFSALANGLANAKITVCFPRCDTHPEMTGNVETLTQRYWECMLSRTIILGRAPQELCDLVGYNPCLTVNMQHAKGQIDEILNRIQNSDFYQEFVDRNFQTALKFAPWKSRMNLVRDKILKLYQQEKL